MKGREPFRRKMSRLSVLLLVSFAAFFLMTAGASASESDRMPEIDGSQELSLSVTMTYTDPNLETDNVFAMSGVEVRLVQVASLAVNGGSADYTLLDAYARSGIELAGMTASESSEAAEALAALVGENGSSEGKTATTDSEGKAVFSGLEAGMYLIFQEESANAAYGVDAIMTMLISVPYPQTASDGNSWIYAVETYPKTELSGAKTNGTITVTKEFYDIEANQTYYSPEDEEVIFFVGLFTDEACTQRVEGSIDLPLSFVNSSSASATFKGLTTDQTYYIAETDGSGNVVTSVTKDGTIFQAAYPNGQAVTITQDQPDGSITFRNTTAGIPEHYYYGGTLTITKKTMFGEEPYVTTGTYYAGIFTDAAFTTLAGEVVELKLEDASSVSVDVRIHMADDSDEVTYYVTETDSKGTPLSNDDNLGFTFKLSKEGGTITLNSKNLKDEIVITNEYEQVETQTELKKEPGSDSDPDGTDTDTDKEAGTEGATAGSSTPQTGDATPLVLTIAVMAAALALLILLAQIRRAQSRK
ncbi:MAG: hypothetical protein LUI13_14990 [Lachnospiraceae bacterium]|nr:hypothetical protein [Lachnospiraceae bacterium]